MLATPTRTASSSAARTQSTSTHAAAAAAAAASDSSISTPLDDVGPRSPKVKDLSILPDYLIQLGVASDKFNSQHLAKGMNV